MHPLVDVLNRLVMEAAAWWSIVMFITAAGVDLDASNCSQLGNNRIM